MGLVNPKALFQKALEGKYAIGAFNVNNMEILQGIVSAAKEENSPVILQISAGARKYAGHNYIIKMVEAALMDANIPIVLHLDHGDSFEICKEVIDHGFSSVMIDGSHYPFEENIALTKKVVDYAHERGVFVEAELGKLAGIEEHVQSVEHVYTDPDQAVEFVERTDCDSLAIAIGTSHGAYKFKGTPKLDFERLKKIHSLMPNFPLVLHGASSVPKKFVDLANQYGSQIQDAQGVPEEMLREATQYGIAKINIDTDIRIAVIASIRKFLQENPKEFDPRKPFGAGRDAVKELVKHKIKNVLGSSNKA
ncbi:MAG: class II fructose-1,6-bisphosphate aldolase [Leptonema sp. (in: bacteria)]